MDIENFLNLIAIGIVLIIIIIPISIGIHIDCGNEQTIDIIVKDKYIKNNGNSDKYMVVDKNNNTYKIEDLFFKGKFNSTDLYNEIEVGKQYKITTTGKRLRFWSDYPNINKIELLEEN